MLNIEPIEVFKYFEEICKIPHGSGNTRMISDYLVEFAKNRGLYVIQDEMNNVIIKKPATDDKKDAPTVILQGHMDMVAVKEEWCKKNLETEGLDLEVMDGYLSAKGTSLGADDGIAVAYMLALLDSDNLSHPNLECIITVDEEIGMLGATGIDLSEIEGKIMMNLDSEDEGVFLLGCAGGATVECEFECNRENAVGILYEVKLTGFKGGHSGVEIDKGRANANVIFGRLVKEIADKINIGLVSFNGGEKDNVIAKQVVSQMVVSADDVEEFEDLVTEINGTILNEFYGFEDSIKIDAIKKEAGCYPCMGGEGLSKMIVALNLIPYGVQAMSGYIEGLVQTSLNLGIMEYDRNILKLTYSVRSSLKTQKEALINKIKLLVNYLGGKTEVNGDYPAWEYKNDSRIREIMTESYEKLFGSTPKFEAIHAGVECGIMTDKIKNLDCISFGPQMHDIHTVNEKLSIESTERTWYLIQEVLRMM